MATLDPTEQERYPINVGGGHFNNENNNNKPAQSDRYSKVIKITPDPDNPSYQA